MTGTEAPAMNVIRALGAVMSELPGIGRDAHSPQGYQYRGIEAITREVQRLFAKHHIVFVPKVIEWQRFSVEKPSGWTDDHLVIEYTVYGPGGPQDCITVGPIHSMGRDNSDKGFNKAMTQAFKYALLQTLCIGDSKEDSDGDRQPVEEPVEPASGDDMRRIRRLIAALDEREAAEVREWWKGKRLGSVTENSRNPLAADDVDRVVKKLERAVATREGEPAPETQVSGVRARRAAPAATAAAASVPADEPSIEELAASLGKAAPPPGDARDCEECGLPFDADSPECGSHPF